MSKEAGVIALGILVVIIPFLGFPESWRIFFLVIAGLALIVLGFMLRAETLGRGSAQRPTSSMNEPHSASHEQPHGTPLA